MSQYHKLIEGATNLIIDYIQSGIGAQLDIVAAQVGAPAVTLENPVAYFIYPKPHGYSLPAVFVICDDLDFRIVENKSNFINAKDMFKISILVEDQDADNLTYKAWRYQSALHQLLDEATLTSADNKLVLKIIVYRGTFSATYMREDVQPGDGGKFRKEILLECQVEHYENF